MNIIYNEDPVKYYNNNPNIYILNELITGVALIIFFIYLFHELVIFNVYSVILLILWGVLISVYSVFKVKLKFFGLDFYISFGFYFLFFNTSVLYLHIIHIYIHCMLKLFQFDYSSIYSNALLFSFIVMAIYKILYGEKYIEICIVELSNMVITFYCPLILITFLIVILLIKICSLDLYFKNNSI